MKALVTGAEGFVGRHLLRHLLAEGFEAHGTTLPGFPFDGWPADPVALHRCDVTDPNSVRTLLSTVSPERIYHLAGQSHVPRSWQDPGLTLAANLLGTVNLLEAIREVCPKARLLIVSSIDVYGASDTGRAAAEDDPTVPTSPYAVSKLAAEHMARVFRLRYGLHVVTVRPCIHTGPGQEVPFVLPSFCRRIARIEAGSEPPVLPVGNLDVERSITDARDMARAYALVLDRAVSGGCFNLGWGEPVPLRTVVGRLISRARVAIRVEVDPALVRRNETSRIAGDPARFLDLTHFVPRFTFEQTVDDTLDFWRKRESSPAT